jgi:hypothetical protein
MADDTPQDSTTEQPVEAPAKDDLGDPGKKALEAERTARREAEKQRKALERELEQVRTANLSEAEKAVAEAEKRGEQNGIRRMAERLVREKFVAQAARRNPDYDASAVLDDLNLGRYLGDDGEPDTDALSAAVSRLVPAPAANPRPVGNADLGAHPAPLALNGDGIENALRKKLGIT